MTKIQSEEKIATFIARLLSNCGLPCEPAQTPALSGSVDPNEILAALEANHIPLLWIRPTGIPDCDWLLETEAFGLAVEREDAYLSDLRAQTLKVRDEFKSHGIDIALIKAIDIAPSFPYKTGNQDILVPPEQVDLARCLLRRLGHIEVRHVHERKKYLYRTFPNGREGLSIHLHEHIGWDGNTFVDADTLWARMVTSQMDHELLIPSPEDIVLITTAHAFEENKQIRLVDLVKLRYCLAMYSLDWDYMDLVASNRGWLYQFYAALYIFNHVNRLFWDVGLLPSVILTRMPSVLEQHRLLSICLERKICHMRRDLPFSIPFSFVKFCTYNKIARDPALTCKERICDILEHSLRGMARKLKIRTQPSMLICFCGIDGSGKTRQAQTLQRAFTTCEVKTKYVWMRGSTSRWLDPFKRAGEVVLRKYHVALLQSMEGAVQKRERIRHVHNGCLRAAYRWAILFELLLFYTKQVTIPLLLGWVVICDRYILDHIVDWMDLLDDPQVYESLPARLLSLMTPAPDVGILLEIPAQVVLARKDDELSLQSVQARSGMLRTLAQRYHLEHANGQKPFERISEELVYSILTKYLDNHWTLVNAIFRYNNPLGSHETN